MTINRFGYLFFLGIFSPRSGVHGDVTLSRPHFFEQLKRRDSRRCREQYVSRPFTSNTDNNLIKIGVFARNDRRQSIYTIADMIDWHASYLDTVWTSAKRPLNVFLRVPTETVGDKFISIILEYRSVSRVWCENRYTSWWNYIFPSNDHLNRAFSLFKKRKFKVSQLAWKIITNLLPNRKRTLLIEYM